MLTFLTVYEHNIHTQHKIIVNYDYIPYLNKGGVLMDTNNIEIHGITPQSEFPNYPQHYPSTQICQIDKLFLACQHDIQRILKIIVTVTISSFKVINTPIGKKVVVQGIKHIKVISSVEKQCHCTHSACFDIPFCLFIRLKDFNTAIEKIGIVVEDISVECLENQFLLVSIIIFAYPIFKCESKPNPHGSCNTCKQLYNYNEVDSATQKEHHHGNQSNHSLCPVCHQKLIGPHTYQSYSDDQ
jgi:hypothetical protein